MVLVHTTCHQFCLRNDDTCTIKCVSTLLQVWLTVAAAAGVGARGAAQQQQQGLQGLQAVGEAEARGAVLEWAAAHTEVDQAQV